jgi:protein SMG7
MRSGGQKWSTLTSCSCDIIRLTLPSRLQQRYLSSHSDYVLERFSKLLAERLLPIGLIVKIYVAALGALWTLRMFRRGSKATKESTSDNKEAKERSEPNQMEAVVLTHVIRLHLALVRIAHPQLEEEAVKAPTGPAAERITAILRRSLQNLRVASKWLRANLEYLSRASSPTRTTPDLTAALAQFWPAYAEMLTLLARVFPADQLQGINVKLEEEIELSGFSPMKGSLYTDSTGPAGQVHPNDEYLLRISDILTDAALIADADVGTAFRRSQLRTDHTFRSHR